MAEPWRARPSVASAKCIAAALLLTAILLLAIVLLISLFLHPSKSKLGFSVDHAAAPGLNVTAAGRLTGAFDLTLRSYNWNKRAAVAYYLVEVLVWCNGERIAGNLAPGFFQPPGNETRFDVATLKKPGPLPRDVADAIKWARRRTSGKLTVDVHVRSRARFRYGVVTTRLYTVSASCPAVVVDFAAPTTFHRVYCHVHI